MHKDRWLWTARILVACAVTSCTTTETALPTAPTREVTLSAAELAGHWRSLERRIPAWFRDGGVEPPVLPSPEIVFSRIRFLEVPHEFLPTCTFNRDTLEIKIGDDKWDSGCVPHELGHAALWILEHPCWNNFEHPNESPTDCF